ncbi:helix-turn-helix domain-containing protein [Youngiibacter multivorans]|uniref:Excisionase family DNA binding protein n=1 Tax=Youngiibacter multivorans TaxID=937251 RepID=A0ABS4G8T5_9CLOT|nr:helix-turn-helix domain-containing protein [Youngiibacter multivorans]MBP1920959.1 excisionase family DNA binding protein [Youngiibacter multivorans]
MTIDIKFYDIKEVAAILGVTPRTVQTYITDGKIKAMKIGNKWKVKEEDLKKYLDIR